MNPQPPDLRVTSPRYWQLGARTLRWARRLSLAAITLASALVAVVVAVVALTGRSAGPVAHQGGQVAWAGALIVPASILLSRMERTFAAYAEACSP